MRVFRWMICAVLLAGCSGPTTARTKAEWVLVETTNLRIRSDLPAERVVALAAESQRLIDAIAEYEFPCAFDRMTERAELVVFAEGTGGGRFRRPRVPYLGLRPQLVVNAEESNRSAVLMHEMAHQLIALCFPGAPSWLHEGTAEFYETARLDGDELTLGYPPYAVLNDTRTVSRQQYQGRELWVLPERLMPSVQELRTMPAASFYSADLAKRIANYAGAWALVHLLRYGEPAFYRGFVRYLRALNAGESESVAWETHLGSLDVPIRYRRYLTEDHQARARQVKVHPPPHPTPHPLSQGQTALVLAQLENWGNKTGERRAVGFIALAEESQDTRSEAARLGAALLLYGDRASDARTRVSSALVRDPRNPDLLAVALAIDLWFRAPDARERERDAAHFQALSETARTSYHCAVAAAWLLDHRDPAYALTFATRSVELDRASFLAYAVAGDAFAALGRIDEARAAYVSAIALSDHLDHTTRATLKQQLDKLPN